MFFRLLGAGLLWTAPLAALAGQSVADHVSMGSAAIEAHDLRTGLAHFDAALALDSSDYAANWRAAVALLDQGQQIPDSIKSSERDSLYARAEVLARRAVAADSMGPEGHFAVAASVGLASLTRGKQARIRRARIVHDEALRMQRIVEDLISLSRIEAERFVQPTEAVALEPLVEQALAGVRHDAAERGSSLASTIEPGLPLMAADRGQILQLLDNLLTNALRYGEAGAPVSVMAESDNGMVHLAIADRGDGIPAEHIARVTERFYRVDTGRSRSIGGTGLGLSIVKHIVERHRGRLDIDSKQGVGTTVHVRLPVAEALS